ncbi:hypothetical protein G7Y79_00031g066360 [Physcia stellaris]|nr:hypothetical protein G7Y79_00031g066360 [Physcia stellaris]
MSRNTNFINNHANIAYPANFLEDPMDDDEVYRMAVTMLRPRINWVNQEPWGVPFDPEASTQYPANFPAKIIELIELVPVPQGDIGDDLRPMIVEVASQNFSDDDLANIAAVLSLAPLNTLETIALLVAYIVKTCWQKRPGTEDNLGEIAFNEPQGLGISVVSWLQEMRDLEETDLGTLTSGPLTFQKVIDIVFMWSDVIVQPTAHERLRFVVDHFGLGDNPRHADLIEPIDAYIASLQTVPRTEMDPTDKCGICLEVYYRSSSPSMKDQQEQQEERCDTALQLPCSHIFCAECLTDWLKTTFCQINEYGEDGYSTCPLCRARISIWDYNSTASKEIGSAI